MPQLTNGAGRDAVSSEAVAIDYISMRDLLVKDSSFQVILGCHWIESIEIIRSTTWGSGPCLAKKGNHRDN